MDPVTIACSFCGKSFATSTDKDIHELFCLICPCCGQSYSTAEEVLTHSLSCLRRPDEAHSRCAHCHKEFDSFSKYVQHENICIGNPEVWNNDFYDGGRCSLCNTHFDFSGQLARHTESCGGEQPSTSSAQVGKGEFGKCRKCSKRITLKRLIRHERSCGLVHKCKHCKKTFKIQSNGLKHESVCLQQPSCKSLKLCEPSKHSFSHSNLENGMIEYETAFRNRLKSYFITSDFNNDVVLFLKDIKTKVISKIKDNLMVFSSLKIHTVLECNFINVHDEGCDRAFKTKAEAVFANSDIESIVDKCFTKLQEEFEISQLKNSGWTLKSVDCFRLKINKHTPLNSGSYVELPKSIACKKACINVKNIDNKCFKYSILSKLVIGKHSERVSKYANLIHCYNFDGLSWPTPIHQIKQFEKRNNISINVFGLEKDNKVFPLKVVKKELTDHRDLLLISSNNGKSHYVFIKHFEKLVANQITNREHAKAICKRCFSYFEDLDHISKEDRLADHKKFCDHHAIARVDLPTKKPYIEFEHVERAHRVPFVIYGDFEAILEPVQGCQPNISQSYSNVYNNHVAMSFCLFIKMSKEVSTIHSNLQTEPYLYRGPNAPAYFMKYLKQIAEKIISIYSRNIPMNPLSSEEKQSFDSALTCYLCEKPFNGNDKVRDHSHLNGRYLNAAHSSCNLRRQLPDFIPVILHNLSGYDSHFIVKELGYDEEQIDVLANSTEKYISFSKYVRTKEGTIKLRFIDSYRFMQSSLDKLVQNVSSLKITSQYIKCEDPTLLTRKGVFPYEYVSCWEKLDDSSLPSKDAFYSRLSGRHISNDDYTFAKRVWNYFNFKTLGEYSDHYLKVDVLQLCDVFENFRDLTLLNHKVDPCHYFSAPGMTWDAMLKYTGVRLELILDYEMILMIEKGIRGGICTASHRMAFANNKYIENYSKDEPSTYILYVDCNNLYGKAMTMPLPYGGFEWVLPESIGDISSLDEETDVGYILEVDLEYPDYLHDLHNDFPFLAEQINTSSGYKKLVPHLGPRKNYIVHYTTLKQAISHGLKLVKINKILKFRQSSWLQPYVTFNTELRKKANNAFEKDYFKLLNNSIFGKSLESLRKYCSIKLISSEKKIKKLITSPYFIDRTIFDENLVAIHMAKKSFTFNKPIYIGMSILDISKSIMYNYHYDVMLPKYGANKLKLCYQDTDSLVYHVHSQDMYQDLQTMLSHLDTSDYPTDHPCYSLVNKKVMGKFKDEMNGEVIVGFVALRAKMYSILLDSKEIKKMKGIQKSSVDNFVRFSDYVKCITNSKETRILTQNIRSKCHSLRTIEVNKVALSPFDDKRCVLEDGVSTLALGHRDCKKE